MDDFYQTLIQDVKTCMNEKDYTQALRLLEAEFAMPYIPKDIEDQLIALYHTCKSELNATTNHRKYDEEDVETLLFGSIDEAFQAIEILKASNIRKHLDLVKRYLEKQPHFLIRTFLIECLIEQDIQEEIALDYDGLDVVFTPTYVELPQQQEALALAIQTIQAYYENDNPTFMMMCVECMMKEMYFKMPFSLGEDEIKPLLYAILLYVYKANDDKAGFEAMIHEKNLANYGGYDLLLYKYDI